MEQLESDAIASTPSTSQATRSEPVSALGGTGGVSLRDRLETLGKRRRDDSEEGDTPTGRTVVGDTDDNPFLATDTASRHSTHRPLMRVLDEIRQQVGNAMKQADEDMDRQDRRLRASEMSKAALRRTIETLTSRNRELEQRVQQLEQKLAERR